MKRGSRPGPLGTTQASAIRRAIRDLGGALAIVVTFALGILGGSTSLEAEQAARVSRIGVLFSGAPAASSHGAAAFDQGMRERG